MKIALDYDGTYSSDPSLWDTFVLDAVERGHEVYIVTARDDRYDELDNSFPHTSGVIYCRGVAKKWWCHHFPRIDFDIWIDDKPESLFENSTATREQLDEWRKDR
jgi:5'(3')-deoxyribonucleotidase